MSDNSHKQPYFIPWKGEIWNIKVGIYQQAMAVRRAFPSKLIYLKLKVVLN